MAAPRASSDSTAKKPPTDNPPPSYDASTGQSASSPSGTTSHRGTDGDDRTLPSGWVKQWDAAHQHFFWVDTQSSPPRSIWTHPLDDPLFRKAHPQYGSNDKGAGYAPPQSAPPGDAAGGSTSHHPPASQHDRVKAAGERAAEQARQEPAPTGLKKMRRQAKDKSTGMDHVQRARHKAEQREMEIIAAEQRRETARAFALAAQFGQAQFLGRDDRTGAEYWAEPPAPGFPPGLFANFPPPYGFESRRDGNRTFVRPAAPSYAYRGGGPYGPMGGGGMGLPIIGGLAGVSDKSIERGVGAVTLRVSFPPSQIPGQRQAEHWLLIMADRGGREAVTPSSDQTRVFTWPTSPSVTSPANRSASNSSQTMEHRADPNHDLFVDPTGPESEHEGIFDAEDSDREVTLSIMTQGAFMGAASFDHLTGHLSLMEDSLASGPRLTLQQDLRDSLPGDSAECNPAPTSDKGVLDLLLDQIAPTRVLASSKCSDSVIGALETRMALSDTNVQIRPAREFDQSIARSKLAALGPLDLELAGDGQGSSIAAKLRYHDFDSVPLSMGAAAALLREWTDSDDTDWLACNEGAHSIKSVEIIRLDACMTVSTETREALSISVGRMPSQATLGQRGSLTLFGLLNNTSTQTARSLLQRWFLFPSTDLSTLALRHDAVAGLSSARNAATADDLASVFKGLPSVHKAVNDLQSGNATLTAWKGVRVFCLRMVAVRGLLKDLQDCRTLSIVQRIEATMPTNDVRVLAESIDGAIDWEQSKMEGRVCIRPGIDRQLDEWREMYAGLPSLLSSVADALRDRYTFEEAGKMNVVYFPQLGYLVVMRFDQSHQVPEDFSVPAEWQFHFASDISAYYKCQEMCDLDEHAGDLHSYIADREVELVHQLSEIVCKSAASLLHMTELAAELDCLLSFARAARLYNYSRPLMTDDGVTDIQGGRHPLHEVATECFQPNDTALVAGSRPSDRGTMTHPSPTIQILTGANGGGKSVYLKQVALICFMAQIGSFVPAAHATLGVCDQILVRIQTRETVTRGISSFISDVSQVKRTLERCTSRSLVLLDEFGKGTTAEDGASLFAATIQHLLALGPQCPRTIATTHFHEVFDARLLPEGDDRLQAYHMEATVGPVENSQSDSRAVNIPELPSLTFLYRLRSGREQDSHALSCAKTCGLPPDVLSRADYFTQLARRNELATLQHEMPYVNLEAQPGQPSCSPSSHANSVEQSSVALAKAAEVRLRAFVAWDIEADLEALGAASSEANLDPRRKLADIFCDE
ncbi:unnamed protein product [Parajaminaea phylloscopi]